MLPRAQVTLLLDEGRTAIRALAESLSQYGELKQQENEAFSLGKDEELQRIEAERSVLQTQIRRVRENLTSLIAQLRAHARNCLDEYQTELKAIGKTAV